MKAIPRYKVLSFFLMAVYLLAACRGVPFQARNVADASPPFDGSRLPGLFFAQVACNMQNKISSALKAMIREGSTVNGVTYSLASFSNIGGVFLVGDQAQLHGMINNDGTFIVREIEKSTGSFDVRGSWSGSEHNHNHHAGNDHSHDHSNDDCHGGHGDAGHHGNSHHGSDDG